MLYPVELGVRDCLDGSQQSLWKADRTFDPLLYFPLSKQLGCFEARFYVASGMLPSRDFQWKLPPNAVFEVDLHEWGRRSECVC